MSKQSIRIGGAIFEVISPAEYQSIMRRQWVSWWRMVLKAVKRYEQANRRKDHEPHTSL